MHLCRLATGPPKLASQVSHIRADLILCCYTVWLAVRKTRSATYRNNLLFPPCFLFGNGKCQARLPRPLMEAKHSHKCDWLRTGSPQIAVTLTLPIKHLPSPFLARSPFSSKGIWDFPFDQRSLNTPPAIVANVPLLPGGPRIPVPAEATTRQVVGGIHTK